MAVTKIIPPPKISDSPYDRQNDQEAQIYIRGSYRCLSRERSTKYFIIVLAFFVCICGIINKYLPIIFTKVPPATMQNIQSTISTYINLSSGVVIILSMLLGFYTFRMHLEGVVLQECFDCYVFNLPRNTGALRPISQTMIDIYASKIKKHLGRFKNLYFEDENDVDPYFGHFDNLNRQLRSDQRLYLSVQSFFLTVWIGFCIVIFILALSFNDDFVDTLINIMFPSLSAITIIMNSWFNFRQQLKQLTTAINEIERIQRMPDAERKSKMSDPFTLRCLQDALYNFRASPFVIPSFLVRRHEKQLAKDSWGNGVRKSSDLIIAINDRATFQRQAKKTAARSTNVTTRKIEDLPQSKTRRKIVRKSDENLPDMELAATTSPLVSFHADTAEKATHSAPQIVSPKKATQKVAPAANNAQPNLITATATAKAANLQKPKTATAPKPAQTAAPSAKPASAPNSATKPKTARGGTK